MTTNKISLWSVAASIACFGIMSTGMWAHLDILGVGSWAIAGILFGLSYWCMQQASWPVAQLQVAADESRKKQKEQVIEETRSKPPQMDYMLAALICLPLIIYFTVTWHWEFPFAGDHDHHMFANHQAFMFWSKSWGWLALFTGVCFFAVTKNWHKLWPFAILIFFIAISYTAEIPQHYFERYPATAYMLNVPFFKLADSLRWNSFFSACRIANFLSPFVWLFLLRPWLFARKPHPAWMILAMFVLLQKEFVFIFSSVLLEPWSIICVLLALESLCHEDSPGWLSLLLIGIACFIKETNILLLPFFALAVLFKVKSQRERWACGGATLVSLVPFAIYYLARQKANVWRTSELVPFNQAFSAPHLKMFWFRIVEQYTTIGALALLIASVVGLYLLKQDRGKFKLAMVIFFGGAAHYIFFLMDKISQDYTGYPRLHLIPSLLLFSPFYLAMLQQKKKSVYLGAGVIALIQSFSLAPYLVNLKLPSELHSFTEDYVVPYYYPLRTLVTQADLPRGKSVRFIVPNESTHPQVLPIAYADLVKQYRFSGADPKVNPALCLCQIDEAVFIPTPRSMNLHKKFPAAPYEAEINSIPQSCIEAARSSCSKCLVSEHSGYEPLAMLCYN